MNKNIIIASVLFLLIGFGVGYFSFKNNPVNNVVENQEVKTETQEQVKAEQNKLFAFLDSRKDKFTDSMAKERGHIKITNVEPGLGLLMVDYSTSPESSSYVIYDYKNDLIYKDIGYIKLGDMSYPVSFIDKSKVLINSGADRYPKIKTLIQPRLAV